MDSILIQIVSTIMLPVFLIMILCAMAGQNSQPVIREIFGLFTTLIGLVFDLLKLIVSGFFKILAGSVSECKKPAPKKKP
jgi:hypothetical protein